MGVADAAWLVSNIVIAPQFSTDRVVNLRCSSTPIELPQLRGWPVLKPKAVSESAVLMGALAVGLRSALDNVFVNRPRAAGA